MPRTLKEAQQQASQQTSNALTAAIAGAPAIKKARRGVTVAQQPKAVEIMVFGAWGSGKTQLIIILLEAGLKVFVINTDFGGNGLLTVYNYFRRNPEKAHLLNNLIDINMNAKDFVEFLRDPKCIQIEGSDGKDIDIYEFDPDVLFWDGGTSYQQVYLEQDIVGSGNFLRETDNTWDLYKASKNGTIFPMLAFIHMQGTSGKPWSKVVTFLDKKDFEKESTGEKDRKGQDIKRLIPGSDKNGPMLHTDARKLSGAGFSICLETSVENFGSESKYYLTVRHADKMVKNRGFNLPDQIDVTEGQPNFWLKYIAPFINPQTLTTIGEN